MKAQTIMPQKGNDMQKTLLLEYQVQSVWGFLVALFSFHSVLQQNLRVE
jgi:hypothetical protein